MRRSVDVLYLHPSRSLGDPGFAVMPVGVFGLLNLLAGKGWRVRGANLAIEQHIDPGFDLAAFLRGVDHRLLLVDLHWYVHSYGAIEVARVAKQVRPDVPVALGGITATLFAREILEEFPCVDYVVRGDAEVPLAMLADHVLGAMGPIEAIPNLAYRTAAGVVERALDWRCRDLDPLDFTSRGWLDHAEHHFHAIASGVLESASMGWICIGRGCLFDCSYCDGSGKNGEALFGTKGLRVRSPAAVAADVLRLHEEGAKLVAPTHDLQMLGRPWRAELVDRLRASGRVPGLYLECFQLPTRELVREVREVFDPIVFALSPLTGDEAVRRANGKLYPNARLFEMLDVLAAEEIVTDVYYSANLPGEEERTWERTIEQIERLVREFPRPDLLHVRCQPVHLDPIAPMREGFGIRSHLDSFRDYHEHARRREADRVGYTDAATAAIPERLARFRAVEAELPDRRRAAANVWVGATGTTG